MIGHPENKHGDFAPVYGLFRMPLGSHGPAENDDALDALTDMYYSDIRIETQYEQLCRHAAA